MKSSQLVFQLFPVTSAFRLGVLLGRKRRSDCQRRAPGSPVPFGWESCWDNRSFPTRCLPLSRHQCLSAGSPVGTQTCQGTTAILHCLSPVPFGWESCWDHRGVQRDYRCPFVTSAFRLGVLLGPEAGSEDKRELLKSPVPFGWESCWDPMRRHWKRAKKCLVTSAFRLGVLLGLPPRFKHSCLRLVRHQCLSAGSPVGTKSRGGFVCHSAAQSPVPFGWESCWDRFCSSRVAAISESHQCLSAGSPVGTVYLVP